MYVHPNAEDCRAEKGQVISRHETSEGTVIYAYCATGGLHMWIESRDESVSNKASLAA